MDDTFSEVIDRLQDGQSITFTRRNVAPHDRFLLFNDLHPSVTATFRKLRGGIWQVYFNTGDRPMYLEDCPDSFLDSILLNMG